MLGRHLEIPGQNPVCMHVHVYTHVGRQAEVWSCVVACVITKFRFYYTMYVLYFHYSISPFTAEVRKDVSGQFHNAICCGNVEECIKVLRSVGQGNGV